MKNVLITLSLTILCGTAMAQPRSAVSPLRMKTLEACQKAAQQHSPALGKTTGLTERLASSAAYTSGGSTLVLTDSVYYGYSGIRGSRFDFNNMNYYDVLNQTNILFDTSLVYNTTGGMHATERYLGSYNANNRLLFQYKFTAVGSTFVNSTVDSFFYASFTRLNESKHYIWNNAQNRYDTSTHRLYAYNTQGLLSEDVTYQYFGNGIYKPQYRNLYTYDTGTGDLLSSTFYTFNNNAWQEGSRVLINYYSAHLPSVSVFQNYSAGWQNVFRDTFGYAAGINFHTYFREQSWNSGAWVNTYLETKHLNAAGLPDTVAYSNWNATSLSWDAPALTLWDYSSYKNPVRARYYTNAGLLTDSVKFHYALYNNPVSVTETAATNDPGFKLYPNPVQQDLHLSLGRQWATPLQLTVINAAGRLVAREQLPANTQQATIATGSWAPALYWLVAQDDKGNTVFRGSFLKQ